MRLLLLAALSATPLLTVGCHSRYVEAAITNHTEKNVLLLEVDYPSASFGTQNLAPGATFRYRFKLLGSGPTKLFYTDATHREHTSIGPTIAEGAEGILVINILDPESQWTLAPMKTSRLD